MQSPRQQQRSKSLWEVLGINSVDTTEQQLVARRVVVVGDALSGKRTFTSRLFTAATQQFPTSSTPSSSLHPANSTTGGSTFSPRAWREGSEVGSGIATAAPGTTAAAADSSISLRSPTTHTTPNLAHFPHGAGIAHAFVQQRIPANRSTLAIFTDDVMSSSGMYGGAGPGVLGGGVRRVMTEFFCCDAPGALAMALPTVEALETSVVLVLVDASTPWRLQSQLRRWYGYLNAHVAQMLQVELPKQDEVRRMHMIEQQQRFWHAQQQALGAERRRWSQREGPCEERGSNVGSEGTSLPMLQMPKDGISPLRTILVCSKTDQLEKLSREVEKSCRGGSLADASGSSNARESMSTATTAAGAAAAAPWVSSGVRSTLRTTGLSLLQLVGQLLRKEAIEHQSGLVGVGSRVNTTATSSMSPPPQTTSAQNFSISSVSASVSARLHDESATVSPQRSHNTFVHPFYKGLWSYIFQLLYELPVAHCSMAAPDVPVAYGPDDNDGNGSVVGTSVESSVLRERAPPWVPLSEEIEMQLSSRFHPHAFLPHGVDHLELLSPFVTSTDAFTLESVFAGGVEDTEEGEGGVLCLHDKYMQQIEGVLATVGPDDDAMIWDKL
ncbi:hypothetical protein DQ04_01321090 [Trypanosoma grayi]|uniref:hypothetical protein n=1 Tax=Trypanosoma grayi TaxID=71804 RepID=UPI0004F47B84|nr:hypothetical protein DQ04_01321090 [Trypanosoma grayi]KEG12936.1 hypothetical protein DQ04_01321090 [Trypanosoma grayi]